MLKWAYPPLIQGFSSKLQCLKVHSINNFVENYNTENQRSVFNYLRFIKFECYTDVINLTTTNYNIVIDLSKLNKIISKTFCKTNFETSTLFK